MTRYNKMLADVYISPNPNTFIFFGPLNTNKLKKLEYEYNANIHGHSQSVQFVGNDM